MSFRCGLRWTGQVLPDVAPVDARQEFGHQVSDGVSVCDGVQGQHFSVSVFTLSQSFTSTCHCFAFG